MVTLMQLQPDQCRYPVGEVDQVEPVRHLFCGAPQQHKSSYCAAHHKICCRGLGVDWRQLFRGIQWLEDLEWWDGEVDEI